MIGSRPFGGPPARVASAIALGLILLAGGCRNPFLPAEPEPPNTQGTADPVSIDFSSPDGLLTTLGYAIGARGQVNGLAAYLGSLADTLKQGVDFHVVMDPAVVADRESLGVKIPPTWGRTTEEADFYNFLAALGGSGTYTFVTSTYGADFEEPDHVVLYRTYTLYVTSADGSSTQNLATGRAEFEMVQIPGPPPRWVLTRWTDHIVDAATGPNPDDAGLRSFSRLRIDSYNRQH